ncbi:MAG: ComEC/Rec2 family competence protein, partial [Armatimonadetes bacterium]|nr:ComEC/Rec2 family competence protein [Armatimonadota bacterium]
STAVAAGAFSYSARLVRRSDDISLHAPARPESVVVRVALAWERPRGVRAVGRAEALELSPGVLRPASGLIYFTARQAQLKVGQRVKLFGGMLRPWRRPTNPFERCQGLYWSRRGVWCHLAPQAVEVIEEPPRLTWTDWAARARQVLTRRLEVAMPGRDSERYAVQLGAIVYGASLDDLPQDLVELYRRTGTIHVLVVSGSQVTVLVVILLYLTGFWRRYSHLWQVMLVLAVTAGYAVLCGREPSILRAAATAAVMIAGLYGGRPQDLPTAMAFVAAALVLTTPADLFSPGFQLTFAAAIGAVGAVRLLEHIVPFQRLQLGHGSNLPRGPSRSMRARLIGLWILRAVSWAGAATVGAWTMTAPILIAHFGGVALTGGVANLFVVPAAELVLLLGLAGVGLALFHPLVATPLLWPCRGLLSACVAVNDVCGRLPLAYLDGLHMSWPMITAWYVALMAFYMLFRSGDRWQRILSGLGATAAFLSLLLLAATPTPARYPTVTWLDVGEGLCTVIEAPGGHFAVYDAGSVDAELSGLRTARNVLMPYLRARGCRYLDTLIVSHPDADHCNAALELVRTNFVRALVVVPPLEGVEPARLYQKLLVTAGKADVPIWVARRGAQLRLGAVTVRFLHPQTKPVESHAPENDNCLVAAVEACGHRVLLASDVERPGQQELLARLGPSELHAAAMQVPHHGRRSAWWRPFCEAVLPTVAVIPCGPWYSGGQPDEDFAVDLSRLGATVLATWQAGAVTVTLAPDGVRWTQFLPQGVQPWLP